MTAMRLVVVGPASALRLQRPAVARRLTRAARVVAVFESFAEAARSAAATRADLLLWYAPELPAGGPSEMKAAHEVCRARLVAVVYRFAGSTATQAFADTGAVVIREPAEDDALGAWLASTEAALSARTVMPAPLDVPNECPRQPAGAAGAAAPRRFDAAALTAFAGLPSTLPCECPRHVAGLLMQLSSFETYSASCINRSPTDAKLHAYLQQVAGASRALFESAMHRVARHEGLPLG